MKELSDELLIEALEKAKQFELDPKFIQLLEEEINKRKFKPE